MREVIRSMIHFLRHTADLPLAGPPDRRDRGALASAGPPAALVGIDLMPFVAAGGAGGDVRRGSPGRSTGSG
ncbi:MAG: hypothetical protein MZV70_19880 [Desulfobacterales bacterium]|nr:hypothetical protein [Desulfobacterales bacterium]